MNQPTVKDRREQVLAVLRAATQPMSIVEVAQAMGVHPNTVRFHLETLTERGRVQRVAGTGAGPGRPPFVFRVNPGMDPEGPRNYALLAEMLVASLGGEPDTRRRAERLGRTWGHRLVQAPPEPQTADDATDRLIELLDGLGFAPERHGGGDRPAIGLRHCPFLELAGDNGEVVCPIHLGLMRGALDELTRTISVDSLHPFVEPDLCVAQLAVKDSAKGSRDSADPAFGRLRS